MNPVSLFLMSVAAIFLIGAFGEIIFRRTQIPDVVWLIAAGIVLGPISGVVTRPALGAIAPYFAAITLVVVLFEGGSRLNLRDVSQAAPRSGLLALLTFLTATGVVAVVSMGAKLVGWFPPEWTFKHGILLGAIVGGSSSIIIMPAMAQAKVDAPVANLVGLESAFTDSFCVVGASAMIDILNPDATAGGSPLLILSRSFGIGLGIGAASGALWLFLLRILRGSEHAYPVTLAALLGLYVLIDRAGGSAALGILTFAVFVGNAPIISEKVGFVAGLDLGSDVRGFHSQMAFIIKSFFFTFIGAMLGPPWSLMILGVLIGAILFGARIPGVYAATLASSFTPVQKKLVLVSLPRGMAAGVLATLPAAAGIPGTDGLPPVVFACVLTTILTFAAGFPLVRRQLPAAAAAPAEPHDPNANVRVGPPAVPAAAFDANAPLQTAPVQPGLPEPQYPAPPAQYPAPPAEYPAPNPQQPGYAPRPPQEPTPQMPAPTRTEIIRPKGDGSNENG